MVSSFIKTQVPRVPKVPDHYAQEVSSQSRRVTGVTPALTKSFAEKPWRYLKKATGLQGMASAKSFPKGNL